MQIEESIIQTLKLYHLYRSILHLWLLSILYSDNNTDLFQEESTNVVYIDTQANNTLYLCTLHLCFAEVFVVEFNLNVHTN